MTDEPLPIEDLSESAPVEKHRNPTRVRVDIEASVSASLLAKEAWPDGEPEEWTVESLAEEIAVQCASPREFISTWNMGPSYEISVVDSEGNRAIVEFKS